MPPGVGITMDAGHLLLAGDDSSWKLSDWEWDSRTFVAIPKQGQPESTSCCKKQKSEQVQGFEDTIARSCGACKASGDAPLNFLQQADKTLDSTSYAGDLRSMDVSKVLEGQQHTIASKGAEALVAVHSHAEGSCQADGCSCDMAQQSVWHQKSRICDKHMSGVFLKQGKAQQFCQQCGRSHNPDAFDQGRKSCRTQLAKHAARRRKRSAAAIGKQQPEGTLQAKVAGTPAATGCKAAVSIAALAMQDASSDAWLQTLCNSRQASDGLSLAQPLDLSFRHSSGSSDHSLSNRTSFSHHCSPPQISEQTSFPACEQLAVYTAGTDTTSSPAQFAAPAMQETMASLWPASTAAGNENPVAAPADDPLQDVLSWQLPPLEEDCKPPVSSFDQALAFMQPGSSYSRPAAASAAAFPVPQQQQQPWQNWQQQQQQQGQQQQQHWQQQQHQQQPHLQSQAAVADPNLYATIPVLNANASANSQMHPNLCSTQPIPSLHSMPEVTPQPYTASTAAVRLSVKLFSCTPAQLPGSLRESVTGWLGSTPAHVEGYIRPGCVHLTVQATVPAHTHSQSQLQSQAQAQSHAQSQSQPQPPQTQPQIPTTAVASVKDVISHLLSSPEEEIWHKCTMLMQLGNEAAVVHQGTALKVWTIHAQAQQQAQVKQDGSDQAACCNLSTSLPSQLPVLSLAQPLCLVAGLGHEQAVMVTADGLSHDCKVLCRAGGKHLDVQMLQSDKGHDKHALQVRIPSELTAGLLYLEVQRGSILGPALPLLVAPTSDLASETAIMLQKTVSADCQGLTVDLALLLQHVADCQSMSRQEGGAIAAANKGATSSIPSFALETSALLAVLARAVSSGLVNLVSHLMSLVSDGTVDQLAAFNDASGMGVLHLAVRSGCLSILSLLLERSSPKCWQDNMAGPAGLTPFHLTVFLPDPQPIALLLCTSLGAHHWFTSAASDGQTPADFAARYGKTSLTHALSKSLWSQASADPACIEASKEDVQLLMSNNKGRKHDCCEEPQSSTSTGCWSDSSSSADDESGSDVDASQHGAGGLSVIPSTGQQSYQVLSAATNFVRDKRRRLAAVIRNRWTPY